jgi:hypothetical protein
LVVRVELQVLFMVLAVVVRAAEMLQREELVRQPYRQAMAEKHKIIRRAD